MEGERERGGRVFGTMESNAEGDKCTTVCKVLAVACSEFYAHFSNGVTRRPFLDGGLAFVTCSTIKLQVSLQISAGICHHVIIGTWCIGGTFAGARSKRRTVRRLN